jgi:lipopolysaccharide cholinephosphotransferase
MLKMTKVFHNLCVKNNIKYMLGYGNLLGAILYNGWIPWDGDMDIMVAEEDYEKLDNILKKDLPLEMWYQTNETDEKYIQNNINKIRDLNSCYIQYSDNGGTHWHNGLQIDLTKYKFIDHKLITYDVNNLKDILYDDIYPLKLHNYEDTEFYIPNNYEKILDQQYGPEWREILPVEKRYPHEGKVDALTTCQFHYKMYPELYPNL